MMVTYTAVSSFIQQRIQRSRNHLSHFVQLPEVADPHREIDIIGLMKKLNAAPSELRKPRHLPLQGSRQRTEQHNSLDPRKVAEIFRHNFSYEAKFALTFQQNQILSFGPPSKRLASVVYDLYRPTKRRA